MDDVQARAQVRRGTTRRPDDRSREVRASSGDFAATGPLRPLRGPRSRGGHGGRSGSHPLSAGTEAARDRVAPLPGLHPGMDGPGRHANLNQEWTMPMQTKPSIVFAHGLWADGSCFSKVIPALQAEGHEVVSAQNSLDTLKGDVVAVIRALGRVSSPAILVGHSYGGTVITAAGTDDRVAGLGYIAALAPDEDETSQSQ